MACKSSESSLAALGASRGVARDSAMARSSSRSSGAVNLKTEAELA